MQQQHVADKTGLDLSVTALQQQVDAARSDLEACLKRQAEQELEHQRLYPFRRFVMQRPVLVEQLAALTMPANASDPAGRPAGASVSCRAFYQRLKQLLGAYLMNSKLMSDGILVNGSTEIRQLLITGFSAALSCATAFIPGSALVKCAVDVGGKKHMADHKQELKNELLQSGHLESFSMMEAEQLAQVVALAITKSYSAQLDELTLEACETLASDAVERIAVSLLDAVEAMNRRYGPQSTAVQTAEASPAGSKLAPLAGSPTGVARPSSPPSGDDVGVAVASSLDQQAAVAVDRLCNLYLFAVRREVVKINLENALRKVLPRFVMKPSHEARDHRRHEKWGADGIFCRSAIAIPAVPSVILPAALHGAATVSHDASVLTTVTSSQVGTTHDGVSSDIAEVATSPVSPSHFDILQLLTLPLNFWELVSVRSTSLWMLTYWSMWLT